MKIDINLKYVPNDLEEIYEVICQMYNIDIRHKTRKRNYVDARAIFYALSRKLTTHSHLLISSFLKQGHCSSLHGVKLFDNLMATDKDFREAARFALFKCCNILEKVHEDSRDYIFQNWSKITNVQQSKICEKLKSYIMDNMEIKLKKESYA
tara:strand:+ start:821 stop:1276 length:456 start_codon:yes stop_codon:yes gene_type:complete